MVSGVLEDAGSKIASTAADAQDRVRAASVDIEAGIERHPLAALLIAFGIDMSLGMMVRCAPLLISLALCGIILQVSRRLELWLDHVSTSK